jgi:hypothetical protein
MLVIIRVPSGRDGRRQKQTLGKCEDKDTTYHNLEHTIQCQNCEHRNIIYYCIDSHPMLMTED